MVKFFKKFIKNNAGSASIEYGLVVTLISVALITGANIFGESLSNFFWDTTNRLSWILY